MNIPARFEIGVPQAAENRDGPTGHATLMLSAVERFFLGETDRANASRLASAFRGQILFLPGRGWGVWDGRRFDFSGGFDRARRACMGLAELIEEEASAISVHPVDDETVRQNPYRVRWNEWDSVEKHDQMVCASVQKGRAERHRNYAKSCANLSKIKSAMELLRSLVQVESAVFDRREELLNCANGTLDLQRLASTGVRTVSEIGIRGQEILQPHEPADHLTKVTGTPFLPGAKGPNWRRFIEMLMPDPEMRSFLQRAFGLSLLGGNPEQVILILLGEGGNGKSTFLRILRRVLGDYAVPCKVELFLETRAHSAGAATPEELNLPGARLYLCTEPDRTDQLSAKKIKAFTGGDARPIRAPYSEQEFLYVPAGIPVIQCNRTPRLDVEDHGARRRLVFLPFEARLDRLPQVRRDQRDIDDMLRGEEPAILNWLVDGFLGYRRCGLDVPAKAAELKRSHVAMHDPIGAFLEERCRDAAGGRLRKTDVFAAYEAWALEEGAPEFRREDFNRIMIAKGYKTRKTSGGLLHWAGISWA